MANSVNQFESTTWNNLGADIYLGLHANSMRMFLHEVIAPAINAIDARHDEVSKSSNPAAAFELSDIGELRGATIESFALAIQSQWERQFRELLKGSARELKREQSFVASLESADWKKLVEEFETLRGLPLRTFDSFPELELLQLLGNACRHGDGGSARKLYERHPEFWVNWPPVFPEIWPGAPIANVPKHPSFSQITLPRSILPRLANAVIWFWEDHNYIYTNSIPRKHYSVDGTLEKMRLERRNRPKA